VFDDPEVIEQLRAALKKDPRRIEILDLLQSKQFMERLESGEFGDKGFDKKLLVDVLTKLGSAGAEIVKGIYSTPWTGIPFTLIVLSQIDPSGKLTLQFLSNLEIFLSRLAVAAGTALAQLGDAIKGSTVKTPAILTAGTGSYCVRLVAKLNVPFVPKTELPGERCFETAADRDAFASQIKNQLGALNFFYDIVLTQP